MIDGLWTAEFGTSAGEFSGGVAVLQNGTVMGGDGGHFYIGTYTLHEGALKATLDIHPFLTDYASVFKKLNRSLTIDLVGSVVNDSLLKAQGTARGLPDVTFGVKLTKRA